MRAVEIFEGRDALLYHGTTWDNFVSLIRDGHFDLTKAAKGFLSTSRSRDYAASFAYYKQNHDDWWVNGEKLTHRKLDDTIVFVLDQAKLARSYRIKPYNHYQNKQARFHKHSEHEEAVYPSSTKTTTLPITPYVVAIFFSGPKANFERLVAEEPGFAEALVPYQHLLHFSIPYTRVIS